MQKRLFEFQGKRKSLPHWCRLLGLNLGTVKRRIYVYKIPVEVALTMDGPRPWARLYEHNGEKKTLTQWCNILKLNRPAVWYRIHKQNLPISIAFKNI